MRMPTHTLFLGVLRAVGAHMSPFGDLAVAAADVMLGLARWLVIRVAWGRIPLLANGSIAWYFSLGLTRLSKPVGRSCEAKGRASLRVSFLGREGGREGGGRNLRPGPPREVRLPVLHANG
jgi:hypothetical protein